MSHAKDWIEETWVNVWTFNALEFLLTLTSTKLDHLASDRYMNQVLVLHFHRFLCLCLLCSRKDVTNTAPPVDGLFDASAAGHPLHGQDTAGLGARTTADAGLGASPGIFSDQSSAAYPKVTLLMHTAVLLYIHVYMSGNFLEPPQPVFDRLKLLATG